MTAFKTQQARWAKGLIQVSKKILPQVLKSDVSRREKIEAWYHLTANLSYPLMIVLSVLLMPAMIIRFYQGWFQMLYIDMPLFLASTFSISSFYLVSQKELFPKSWLRSLLYLPLLMALGIGLTHHQYAKPCWKRWSDIRPPSRALRSIASNRRRTKSARRNIASVWAGFRGSNC